MNRRRCAVLGLGHFGQALAAELAKLGGEVLAVDVNAKKVEAIRDAVTVAAQADIRDREALKELLSNPFDVAVVAIGSALEASIMATLHLKEMGLKEIWAEASSDDHAEVLRRVGADKIIAPERDTGRRVAQSLMHPNLLEYLPLTRGHAVVEMETPAWTHGQTLGELQLRNRFHVAVIAIRAPDGTTLVVPGADAELRAGHVLTVVGKDADLAAFRERT